VEKRHGVGIAAECRPRDIRALIAWVAQNSEDHTRVMPKSS
jgi:hypothetical protein